ncbi:P-loop containing nucleoside triphosphate hydrolase protein [Lophiotrema nucula]|uniref:DNA 3'-5' helicase n=1 Tax=Lophiotrema nucula TaxID=690887 RepID=A0A6A5ZQ49_9PLEO|nr:P-loop containing nucleoside triphosphate hydrolase protein [Lophiotrema nucula]
MPKHNLGLHLKWLLSEKPFVPPSGVLPGYDPNADPPSSATLSQSNSFGLVFDANDDHAPPVVEPSHQPVRPATRLESRPTIRDRQLPGANTEVDMARLRATPGNGKPKLMLAEIPGLGAPPASADRTRRNSRDGGQPEATRRRQPEVTPASTSRPAASRQKGFEAPAIAAIDLTDDSNDVASSSPVPVKKGKKRKSEEYEEDLRLRKSPRPVRAAPAEESDPFDNDFVNIDSVLEHPDSPPPPYSTTVPGVQQANVFNDHEDLGMTVPDDDEMMAMQEAEMSPVPKKRKSLSRVPSEATAPPRKIGKQAKSPSPTKRSRSRREVMDSEDDDFGNMDDFGIGSPPASAKLPFHTRSASPQKGASQRSVKYAHLPNSLTKRSPIKRDISKPTIDTRNEPNSPILNMQHRVLEKPISKQVPAAPPPASAQSQSASSAGSSKEQREAIRKVVEDFLDAEGHRLKQLSATASLGWDKARTAYASHVEEFGTPQVAETKKMQRAKAKKDALEQLVALKSRHDDLSAKRATLRAKIENDLNEGDIDIADGQALNKARSNLEDLHAQIHRLLDAAGMGLYCGAVSDSKASSGIMVKSTQVANFRDVDTRSNRDDGNVPQTQYVRQTQIAVRETWTPSKHIRFREGSPTKSPPPPPMFASKTSQIAKGSSKVEVKSEDAAHRVPETPQQRRPPILRLHPRLVQESSGHVSPHGYEEAVDAYDDNVFKDNMGTPPRYFEEDENFCDDDDDDFMAIDEETHLKPQRNHVQDQIMYDWMGHQTEGHLHTQERPVFRETSINTVPQRRPEPSPRKSQSTNVGMNFPWSLEVKNALLNRFKLRGFRPGQLEAVNATLSGDHCFVLMPTGGGKSLCYQLPSVIASGNTRGVTIVVSPLLSLMEDQVEACRSRFGMQAQLINGESTSEEKKFIMQGLREDDPQQFIQLLYVTPEMLSKNQTMVSIFKDMHQKRKLARIVVDEAHCVSQWGHDFRPDYKALGEVLRQFSGVPIIALTATATRLVQKDLMANLGIEGCRKFSQSFNRPNLSYTVLPKAKNAISTIAKLIKDKYAGKSGIVYCLARKTCEKVAEQLSELGIKAHHYHAGMDSTQRSDVQRKWQSNKYHVIVATIAFGMGIDKADVRFVVHHSLPKSLEGYYQETGRAGRDGKRSGCYLYYMYADCKVLRKMIEEGDGNLEQKQRQLDMLRLVIQYCENRSDCRRAQVLNYFSEPFRKENCNKTCDNCESDATYEKKDLTEHAAAAIRLVQQVQEDDVTLLQCVDAFRGAKNSKIKESGLDEHGFGRDLERGDVERLFQSLLDDNALKEITKMNRMKFGTNYVKLGTKSRSYLNQSKPFCLQVRVTPRKSVVTKKATKKKTGEAAYPSTNVSSPIRAPQKRNMRQYVYDEADEDDDDDYYEQVPTKNNSRKRSTYERDDFVVDDNEEDDDGFAPIREGNTSVTSKRKALSGPITTDERLAGLDEYQKDVLRDFMQSAKETAKAILLEKNLRSQPFSDTVLREMGLDLPMTEDELLAVPGIRPEMAELYGKRFFKLIRAAKEFYGEHRPTPRHLLPRRRPVEVNDDDDEEEQRPADPNHQVVVDLCSSEPEEEPEENEFDDDEGLLDIEPEDDNQFNEASHFFAPTRVDPRVEEYNRRGSQLEAQRLAKNPTKVPRAAAQPAIPTRNLPWHQKGRGGAKRKSSGGHKKGDAGVTKKGTAKKTTARSGSGSFGASKRSGGGAGGRSGISAMPT